MRLKPHEILKHLGFDISEDGVEINPFDMYLLAQVLSLTGRTLNVNAITDDDLLNTRRAMAFLVAGERGEPEQAPTNDSAEKLRALFSGLLKKTFKCTNDLDRK